MPRYAGRRLTALAFSASLAVLMASAPAVASEGRTDTASIDAFVAQQGMLPENAQAVSAWCDAGLAQVADQRIALERSVGPATIDTTFRDFDNLMVSAFALSSDAQTVGSLHVEASVRQAALACAQQIGDALTGMSMSRDIYDRLSAIDTVGAGVQPAFFLQRALDAYRLAGVDKDEATRAQLTRLQERITAATLAFQNNINNARVEITVTADELSGLPADYIANHPPGADGLIRISTDYPDMGPIMIYAEREEVRRRLAEADANRAPENAAVLADMLAARYELAQLLGHPDFAHLATSDKMTRSPAVVRSFMDELDQVTAVAARRDYDRMARRLGVDQVQPWSTAHALQLLRKEEYDVDPQEVRRYFAYNNVRDGIFRLTEDLFKVDIRPWATPVWADEVQAFEMVDRDEVIGRFYFDSHPRAGKYSHAAIAALRIGLSDRSLPIAVMMANFPAGDHSTGLMEHRDVETFLHEFGHMLHVMFSGRTEWAHGSPFMGLEMDFIEAPSQMLENWVWDYDTLATFAVDADGQTIPRALVDRMVRARGFGEAFGDRRQLGYAAISLDLHTGAPPADIGAAAREANNRYSLAAQPAGMRPENSFGHLGVYSALYYTYLWSKTISSDLFTPFETEGLRNAETARRYREQILAPGSSRPAGQLVQDFLGRPLSLEAYRRRLGN